MPELGTRIVPPLGRNAARIYGVVISYTQRRACTSSKARHASLSDPATTRTFILPYFCSLALPAFCLPQPCHVACHNLVTEPVAARSDFWSAVCRRVALAWPQSAHTDVRATCRPLGNAVLGA
jgi:hypothetical protein